MKGFAGPYCKAFHPGAPDGEPWQPSPADDGAPAVPDGTWRLLVRWRAPGFANPRKHTASDASEVGEAVELAGAIACAVAADDGWTVDARGWPRPADDEPPLPDAAETTDPAPEVPPLPGPQVSPPQPVSADRPPAHMPGPWRPSAVTVGSFAALGQARVDNPALAAAQAGAPLGDTFEQHAIAYLEAKTFTTPSHRTNWRSALGFAIDALRYRAPFAEDTGDVAAFKAARNALPGVVVETAHEPGGSIHLSLLTVRDLADALAYRRHTDQRYNTLQRQADDRYRAAVARREAWFAGPRKGRPPAVPRRVVYEQREDFQCSPDTERFFATVLGEVLNAAAREGRFGGGPNPWQLFTARHAAGGSPIRRARRTPLDERLVVEINTLMDIADAIAGIGPVDRASGRPRGDRYRAPLALLAQTLPRREELDRLLPDPFVKGGETGTLVRYAGAASQAARADIEAVTGAPATSNIHRSDRNKSDRDPRGGRLVPVVAEVRELAETHIARGYTSTTSFVTSPLGEPVRWSNIAQEYVRPAIHAVLGDSPALAEFSLKHFRKSAITWLIASGMREAVAAEYAGHTHLVQGEHYAGVFHDRQGRRVEGVRRTWTTWEEAWAFARRGEWLAQ